MVINTVDFLVKLEPFLRTQWLQVGLIPFQKSRANNSNHLNKNQSTFLLFSCPILLRKIRSAGVYSSASLVGEQGSRDQKLGLRY